MCLRVLYYIACTQCNSTHAPYGGTPEEAKEQAQTLGWEVDIEVPNGSLWDFCPRCVKKNKASEA